VLNALSDASSASFCFFASEMQRPLIHSIEIGLVVFSVVSIDVTNALYDGGSELSKRAASVLSGISAPNSFRR
jgi:hypothetical protein